MQVRELIGGKIKKAIVDRGTEKKGVSDQCPKHSKEKAIT
jgi:hypothetical protein